LVYVCIVASLIGSTAEVDGIDFQYLWPNRPELNYIAITLASSLAQVFTTGFAILFMGIHRHSKKIYRLLIALIILDLSSAIGIFVLAGETSLTAEDNATNQLWMRRFSRKWAIAFKLLVMEKRADNYYRQHGSF
jgi:uncharacterized membrane protein YbhN (UPF0104 family)